MDKRAAAAKRRRKVVVGSQVCYGKAELRAFRVLVRKREIQMGQLIAWQKQRAAQARRMA